MRNHESDKITRMERPTPAPSHPVDWTGRRIYFTQGQVQDMLRRMAGLPDPEPETTERPDDDLPF